MAIKVLEKVRFKIIPREMLTMFGAILWAADRQGKEPTVTGAAYENYPKGKVHDQGYAIDVRIADIEKPYVYALDIENYLLAVSQHYKVLYGDPTHLDHIHIGFAWAFAHDNQQGA